MVSSRVAFKSMNFSILVGKFYKRKAKNLKKKTVNNQKKMKFKK